MTLEDRVAQIEVFLKQIGFQQSNQACLSKNSEEEIKVLFKQNMRFNQLVFEELGKNIQKCLFLQAKAVKLMENLLEHYEFKKEELVNILTHKESILEEEMVEFKESVFNLTEEIETTHQSEMSILRNSLEKLSNTANDSQFKRLFDNALTDLIDMRNTLNKVTLKYSTESKEQAVEP